MVRAGSFAAAARRLGMPANTASRRIQQLEQLLGLRLMQRSTRKLTLTDAGATFYARLCDQVEALTEAAQELGAGSHLPSGRVRVAAAADFFSVFRMELIAEFLDAYQKFGLEFVLSDERADLIEQGIDVAIRSGKVARAHIGRAPYWQGARDAGCEPGIPGGTRHARIGPGAREPRLA